MVFGLFRRKDKGRGGQESLKPGPAKGKFVLQYAYNVMSPISRSASAPSAITLMGIVVEGDISEGDLLALPDGRLLSVIALETSRGRTSRALMGESVGVVVRGVGWKPRTSDLGKYAVAGLIKRLKAEAEAEYKGVPEDARRELVSKRVAERLRNEAPQGKILTIHYPSGTS